MAEDRGGRSGRQGPAARPVRSSTQRSAGSSGRPPRPGEQRSGGGGARSSDRFDRGRGSSASGSMGVGGRSGARRADDGRRGPSDRPAGGVGGRGFGERRSEGDRRGFDGRRSEGDRRGFGERRSEGDRRAFDGRRSAGGGPGGRPGGGGRGDAGRGGPSRRPGVGRPFPAVEDERDRPVRINGRLVGGLAARGAGNLVGRRLGPRRNLPVEGEAAERRDLREGRPGAGSPASSTEPARTTEPAPTATKYVAADRRRAPETTRRADRPPTPVRPDREELSRAAGAGAASKVERRLRDAARAFDDERYDEALPLLRNLAQDVPSSAQVRELYGLALYQVGRWSDAVRELEQFGVISGSTEQHPVLADCYRALRRWDDVDRLWGELREASPSRDLVNEGRIVAAGALADRGRLEEAIALLAAVPPPPAKRVRAADLRRWYALADLQERAGALGQARDIFRRIAAADPEFYDVRERVRGLG